jgi:hypothetical protein
MRQVFSGRMLSHKWTKTERSVAVSDIVYLAEAENDDPSYRMGVVEEVRPRETGVCGPSASGKQTLGRN